MYTMHMMLIIYVADLYCHCIDIAIVNLPLHLIPRDLGGEGDERHESLRFGQRGFLGTRHFSKHVTVQIKTSEKELLPVIGRAGTSSLPPNFLPKNFF